MKKYFVLTSVLVLAACGGGSGSISGSTGSVNYELTAEQRAAASSNQNVTEMYSFVIDGGSNPTVNPNAARSASNRNGVALPDGGTLYDLENVDFKTASLIFNTGLDNGAMVKFKTDDNGQIDGIELDNVVMHADVSRQDTGTNFIGTYTCGESETGGLGVSYNSEGKANDLGLRYSDFGVVKWGDPGYDYDSVSYFAGGYDVRKVRDLQNIGGVIEFSGVANGDVIIGDWNDVDSLDSRHLDTTTNANPNDRVARLTFNNGTSTLEAKFDNWYDVSATMDSNGNLASLDFTNGDKGTFVSSTATEHHVAHDFKWNGQDAHSVQKAGFENTEQQVLDGFVGYYGDNNNPAEAVGVLKYGVIPEGHDENTMRFDMGFGGTRQ